MSVWQTEAEMVASFVAAVNRRRDKDWTVYAETCGWDLLLVHRDGYQLGLEAKLSLNAKVIDQALSGTSRYSHDIGPDYRGVVVPNDKIQLHLGAICRHIGIGIIAISDKSWWSPDLPDEKWSHNEWPNWCVSKRCTLPDYVPDVAGGHAAPVKLTTWKIKAIKLAIVLDKRGYVTRADMKALDLSPRRWTDFYNGLLARDETGKRFVKSSRTPDFRSQHPTNYAEIEQDFPKWSSSLPDCSGLFGGVAQ